MKQQRDKEISAAVNRIKPMNDKIELPILPEDVIVLILSMLPAKSIIRFRCVCKPWSDLPKNPGFIKKHLNHAVENNKYSVFLTTVSYWREPSYYRVDFDEASASSLSNKAVKIDLPIFSSIQDKLAMATIRSCIGSCNGIFCFIRYIFLDSDSVIVSLWNPSTQELKEIVYKIPDNGYVVAYGFGYDYKIDDYKLILIFKHSDTLCKIHVYTVGSSSWKNIGNTPCVREENSMKLLNGSMHWVAKKGKITSNDHRAVTTVIVSFDLAEETTKEIQIPNCLVDERYRLKNERVDVLGKDLYFAVHVEKFELWVMKDYGVVDSWTKLLSYRDVMGKIYIREALLCFNKNRQILLNCYENGLASYDVGTGSLKFLKVNNMPVMFTAETFIGSLVSLT